jgi:hypothetical protein
MHGLLIRFEARTKRVIGVRNVDVWPEHIVIANLDQPAGVNHEVPVKVIPVANPNSNALVALVVRPKPASLSEGVVGADLDL